jgi:ferredoxin-type protein NapF
MVSRRQFIQGNFKAGTPPQRPPWALTEEAFLDACSRCGDCITACPTHIIVVTRGYPVVDFSRGECTFCGDCANACKDGALRRGENQGAPWSIKAHIAESCLAQQAVECRICGDPCPVSAIRFKPRIGKPPLADVDLNTCTGCGACVAPCPTAAISVA